jgi:hypothetical protein
MSPAFQSSVSTVRRDLFELGYSAKARRKEWDNIPQAYINKLSDEYTKKLM